MFCADCEHSRYVCSTEEHRVCTFRCLKYGILCDTSHLGTLQCIEDDCDVIWRAAMQKGSRYDG